MKCRCGGFMQLKRLSIDTYAHVCMLCGRDDLPRRVATGIDADGAPAPIKPKVMKRKTCPGCYRPGLIFTGKCGRCRERIKRGLDLVTGMPIKTGAI